VSEELNIMKNSSPDKFSLKSRLKSFGFAINGLALLLKNEHNSRIHLVAAIGAVALGLFLKINLFEWVLITIVIGLVFMAELFNSAIESIADRVDPGWNEFIGKAKDYSAAAVFICAIIALITGCLIFIPKISGLF
jgi:diacylglycerol kinase